MTMGWTAPATAILRDCAARGLTATQIVAALADIGFPATRNSVLGRAFRLKLSVGVPLGGGRVSRAWTAEMDAVIRQCVEERVSSAVAATRLTDLLGRSVLPVSARRRAWRLGLHFPGLQGGRKSTASTPRAAKTKPKAAKDGAPQPSHIEIVKGEAFQPFRVDHVKLEDLRPGDCRWPLDGEDGKTLFCGAARDGDRSYCATHRHLARAVWQPLAPGEKRQAPKGVVRINPKRETMKWLGL